MDNHIKLVAVDIDGTFVRSDYSYDIPRFQRILTHMKEIDCHFVVASGNQYYQLRSLFPNDEELSFVAENAAFGDGGNDIEMLEYCGYSFAMANAADEVKQAAKYRCPSNEEDGVLVTLEALFDLD